jgi:acyl-CoA thioester hydrolase
MSDKELRRADFPVLRDHPTRWADVDAYGHLNNVVHYSLFDSAVNQWLMEASGLDVRQLSSIGMVVETSCKYFAELQFPGVVTSGLRLTRFGRTSVAYGLALFSEDAEEPAAVGTFTNVYVDRETRRPVPPPEEIVQALTALGG